MTETASPPTEARSSFWARQTADTGSPGQRRFDVAAGVFLPIACAIFDPIVFKDWNGFHPWALAGYTAIALGALLLSMGFLSRRAGFFLAGALYAGSLFALALGLVMLPLSVMGLVVIIGVLGFSPFVVSFVFWRNAVRVHRAALGQVAAARRNLGRLCMATAFAGTLALPALAEGYANRYVATTSALLMSDDPAAAAQGQTRLRRARFVLPLVNAPLEQAFEEEPDARRRAKLAQAYQEVTGKDLELLIELKND